MSLNGQLDLFAADEAEAKRAERDAWLARFDRHELARGDGLTVQDGFACPACGEVESEYGLVINHGYDVRTPGRTAMARPFGETCVTLWLRASQARSAEQRAESAARSRAFSESLQIRGKARAPWRYGLHCAACGGRIREGDWCRRHSPPGRRKRNQPDQFVHDQCPTEETP